MLFLILISAFPLFSKEKPVATVANKKVFEKDIPDNLTLDQHLQNLVFFELAKEKGYVDSVKTRIDKNFDQEIIKRTVQTYIKAASQPSLYECTVYYKNSKKKISIQLIQTENLIIALKAYFEVLKGKDFGTISEKYSSNPQIKKSKGLLNRPIQWSSSLPPTFKRIFNMEQSEVSIPLKYRTTWNIIKIIDIKEQYGKNVLDKSSMLEDIAKPEFKMRVSKDKSSLYINKVKMFLPWLANVKVDSKNISFLCEKITALNEKSASAGLAFKDENLNIVLARSTMGEYKIVDFLEDAARAGGILAFANEETASRFIEEQILNGLLTAICKRIGTHRGHFLATTYEKNIRNSTLDFFKRKEILPIIKENDNDLKDFYKNNKDKYIIAERRKVFLIEVKEEKEAHEIIKRLIEGEKFQTLAQEVSIGKGKKRGGDIGYIEKNQQGSIGQVAFELQKGENSKPFKTQNGWAIIKVTDIKKGYLPDYSNVKPSVRMDYRTNKAEDIGDKIFEQNKEKYKLKILS